MDKRLIDGVVFLDLRKAFDTVDHIYSYLNLNVAGSEVMPCNGFNHIYMKENKFAELKKNSIK